MRLICFMALVTGLAMAASAPAAAQTWKEYSYPDYAFAVSFPADPETGTASYDTGDGHSAAAHVYSAHEGNAVFRMTVVDLPDQAAEESTVIGHAITTLAQGGEIKVDIPHRVRRVYGRQISVTRPDGSRALAAVFLFRQHLYQIEGLSLAGGPDASADAIRFQQSLVFTGNESNRPDVACGAPGAPEPARRCGGRRDRERNRDRGQRDRGGNP